MHYVLYACRKWAYTTSPETQCAWFLEVCHGVTQNQTTNGSDLPFSNFYISYPSLCTEPGRFEIWRCNALAASVSSKQVLRTVAIKCTFLAPRLLTFSALTTISIRKTAPDSCRMDDDSTTSVAESSALLLGVSYGTYHCLCDCWRTRYHPNEGTQFCTPACSSLYSQHLALPSH